MVGDSDNDAIGADSIGLDFVGVTYRFGFKDSEDTNRYPKVGCAGTLLELLYILIKE